MCAGQGFIALFLDELLVWDFSDRVTKEGKVLFVTRARMNSLMFSFPKGWHQVSQPGPGHDVLGSMRIILQFLTQAGNAYPEDLLIAAIFRSPNAGQKILGGHDLANMMSELQQEPVLGRRKGDWLFPAPHFCTRKVNL